MAWMLNWPILSPRAHLMHAFGTCTNGNCSGPRCSWQAMLVIGVRTLLEVA